MFQQANFSVCFMILLTTELARSILPKTSKEKKANDYENLISAVKEDEILRSLYLGIDLKDFRLPEEFYPENDRDAFFIPFIDGNKSVMSKERDPSDCENLNPMMNRTAKRKETHETFAKKQHERNRRVCNCR